MAFQYPTLVCKCVWNNIPSEPYFNISHIAMTTSMLVPLFGCILLFLRSVNCQYIWLGAVHPRFHRHSPLLPLWICSRVALISHRQSDHLANGKRETCWMYVVWPESKEDGKRCRMCYKVLMEMHLQGLVDYNVKNNNNGTCSKHETYNL